jgi:large subunit ribosomal protein L17
MSYVNKPGKNSAWRKQRVTNLLADVILYEKIETSLPQARRLTKLVAKLVGWAKVNTLHSRRLALRYLVSKKNVEIKDGEEKIKVLPKLFDQLGKRYQNRPGGYSRIIKMKTRRGDSNLRVILSLV